MAYHLLQGFRVRVAKKSLHDHWQGGPALHDGAECPTCKRPLLLLWAINCADPRFVRNGRPVFKGLQRLPLYYCWGCCAEVDYRLADPGRIEVIRIKSWNEARDYPYRPYPKAFERRPIELDRLIDMPKNVLELLSSPRLGPVPIKVKRPLEKWLGRSVYDINWIDAWWHQFGGHPPLMQGDERIPCPNTACSWSRRGWSMKVLASLRNDPPSGLPMIESMRQIQKNKGHFDAWMQVNFHICRNCLTIHACNRCT